MRQGEPAVSSVLMEVVLSLSACAAVAVAVAVAVAGGSDDGAAGRQYASFRRWRLLRRLVDEWRRPAALLANDLIKT